MPSNPNDTQHLVKCGCAGALGVTYTCPNCAPTPPLAHGPRSLIARYLNEAVNHAHSQSATALFALLAELGGEPETHHDRVNYVRALASSPSGERCRDCGQSQSCCVGAIGYVGDGVPLDSIGVGEDATTLYTGEAVRALLSRAPQPSVPSGEAVAWGVSVDGALQEGHFSTEGPLAVERWQRNAKIRGVVASVPLYAAPPQDRVSEARVTDEMVKAFIVAQDAATKPKERYARSRVTYGEMVRAALTAALSAGRGA